jgi:hypothetical protein
VKVIEQIVRLTVDGDSTKAEVVGELVRCKDCKHRNGSACDYSAVWLRENGFCQWGERSEDGN